MRAPASPNAATPPPAANLVYRCGLVRQGAEESVVLARIHATRGGGDKGGGGGGEGAHAHGAGGAELASCHGTDPHSSGGGGGSDLFDRGEEIATFAAVSDARLGPRLLLLFNNGRLEEFLVE